MAYQTVRALRPIRHLGVLHIPGQTTGDHAQDFVVNDNQAAALVAAGAATAQGSAAAPLIVRPIPGFLGHYRGDVLEAIEDDTGNLFSGGGSSGPTSGIGAPWATFGDSMDEINAKYWFRGWDGRQAELLNRSGYINWASLLSGRKIYFDHTYDFGVGGETSAQMYDQFALAKASDAHGVILTPPINDLTNGIEWNLTRDRMIEFCQGFLDAGKQVIMLTAGPTSNPDATYRVKKARYNSWVLHKLRQLLPKVYVADANAMLTAYTDANGSPIGGGGGWEDPLAITSDGVHARSRYAICQGRAIADVVNIIYPGASPLHVDPLDVYDATYNQAGNVLTNPMFATGGSGVLNGGASANVHYGLYITKQSGDGVVSVSKTTRDAGNGNLIQEQTIQINAAAATTETVVTFSFGYSASPPVGHVSEFTAFVSFVSGSKVTRLDVDMEDNTTAGGNVTIILGDQEGATPNYMPDTPWQGVIGGRIVQTAGSTFNRATGTFAVAAGSSLAVMRISCMDYRDISAIAADDPVLN